jgi:transposase, IS5 family
MLRLTSPQHDFWDYLLPPGVRAMSRELEAVDALLDDERFLDPFRTRFTAKRGRCTIPMETYLRLMYLKMRYQLGYESLVAEVSDSVSWRRFCRISLSDAVPDASTLIKLTNGPCQGLAEEVHGALVQRLAEKKVLHARQLRVDTTVVEADIRYPTDADLLADGARVITRTMKRLQRGGLAAARPFRGAGPTIRQAILSLAKGLKQADDRRQVTRASVTAKVLGVVERLVRRVRKLRQDLEPELTEQRAGVHRQVAQLDTWIARTERVIWQTQQVLGGNVHIKDRLVSLFDPDARPIRKGKLNVAGGTEFGYKVAVADEERGFVTAYAVYAGNPEDGTVLVPTVDRHIALLGRAPHAVATDRGMTSGGNERALSDRGVVRCSLPRPGKKGPTEDTRWFRRLQRFRAGGEARISLLKRQYGWRRSRLRGAQRTETWVGWGVITHNLTRYARLEAQAV